MKPRNPFLVTGYAGPEFFCDRESETGKLLNAIRNERNITITSIRRMGKTDLIKHAFYKIRNDKNYITVYVDLQPTNTVKDMVRKIGEAIFKTLGTYHSRWFKKLINELSGLRPKLTFDSLTGQPVVQLDIIAEEIPISLEKIFGFISNFNRRVILTFDEFQQITRYPENNTQALLRSHIQGTQNLGCIFSGSNRNILASMFQDYSQPFYQSTDIFYLERIDTEKYGHFIAKKFDEGGISIPEETVKLLLQKTRNHTYYVQYYCNQLYSSGFNSINQEVADMVWNNIIKDREGIYYNYRNLFTSLQFSLLKAIAIEGYVEKPLSKEFLHKYDLPTPSSIKSALEILLDKDFVHFETERYLITDVFLDTWLRQLK